MRNSRGSNEISTEDNLDYWYSVLESFGMNVDEIAKTNPSLNQLMDLANGARNLHKRYGVKRQ